MSSSHLCPCPACNRHVMTDAGVCPFCQAALPASFCEPSPPPTARGRMSRAARLLAGATLVGVSACQSSATPVYGAPFPVDAAADRQNDTGAGGAPGNDAATGTGGAPSNDAAEDRSAVALYGAPPASDGSVNG